jgi:hypothetical protein
MANTCASAAVFLKSELHLRAHCTAGLGPHQVFNCRLTFHLPSILQQTKIIHLLLAVSSGLKASSVCWADASGGRSCSLSRIKNETFVVVVADRCESNNSRLFVLLSFENFDFVRQRWLYFRICTRLHRTSACDDSANVY